VQINQDDNSITFYYDPLESKEDVLIILSPDELIENIQVHNYRKKSENKNKFNLKNYLIYNKL